MSAPGGVNLAVVELLLGCANFSPEAYAARELRHDDGRPFTDEEHELVSEARRPELLAVRDFYAKAAEDAEAEAENMRLLAEMVRPYVARFGPGTSVADVRALMPADQRAQLDELLSRIGEVPAP